MLKTINFAVFKCMECGNTIKVNPSQPVEKVECTCKQVVNEAETIINIKPKPPKAKKTAKTKA